MDAPTFSQLLSWVAQEFPSHRAISGSGKYDLSHSRLHELIERAASRLVAAGINADDVIALTFPTTVEFVITFLAVIRARATAALLNPAYTPEEFEFYLLDSESKLLITSQEGNKSAEATALKLKITHATASLSKADDHELSLSLSQYESEANLIAELVNDPSDVALFLHTSGTTTCPKGVPLTQFNIVSSVKNIKSVYKLTESDSTVIVLPLFHVHGLIAGLLSSLGAGAAVALPAAGRFSDSTFWSDMIQFDATWYTAVPIIHQIILDCHVSNVEPVFPKLWFIRSCSTSLAPSILRRLEEAFGAPALDAHGMTEAAHLMSSNPLPEDGPHKLGSVGKPVGQEMAILDEKGEVQKADVKGEINCAIIPREGSNIDEAEVLRFCKKNVAAFKVLKKVFITDSWPKTATGKILRRLVAEKFHSQVKTVAVTEYWV